MRTRFGRRDFLKRAAAGGAAITASAALGRAQAPSNWDREADIVCVGYGGAGAITAITAAGLGATVVILEKQPGDTVSEIRHTPNTRSSGGVVVCPTDAAKAAEHLFALSWGSTPREVCAAWGKYTVENVQWIEKMGGRLVPEGQYLGTGEFPDLPGYESIKVRLYSGGGPAFFKMLDENVKKRKAIEVIYEAPGMEPVINGTGTVIGVIAQQNGRKFAVKARKAVILTTGGYEWDEELKLNTLRGYPSYFYGNPGNTGDGIRMAQKAGAALWHLNTISGRVIPYFEGFKPALQGGTPRGFILVDKYGRRFVKERPWAAHSFWLEVCVFDTERTEYPRIPCYSVFDDDALKLGPPATGASKGFLPDGKTQQSYYTWSKDFVDEINKGWLLKGETIEDLAALISKDRQNGGRMTATVLRDTIEEYNRFCAAKKDIKFEREAGTLVPVKKGPFYALKMYPGGPNTQGGPTRNAKSQVLDSSGKSIPHLYAAGELGSVYGFLYPTGGGNLAEMIAFGRIAAENAVNEKPWK
jgi:succinate dehydrogenase/fumarate reductase flavoprotein subunit